MMARYDTRACDSSFGNGLVDAWRRTGTECCGPGGYGGAIRAGSPSSSIRCHLMQQVKGACVSVCLSGRRNNNRRPPLSLRNAERSQAAPKTLPGLPQKMCIPSALHNFYQHQSTRCSSDVLSCTILTYFASTPSFVSSRVSKEVSSSRKLATQSQAARRFG